MEKKTFSQAVEAWGKHVNKNWHHGDTTSCLDCDEYRFLVACGVEVLPLIKDLLNGEREEENVGNGIRYFFVDLVSNITGQDFIIPEEIHGRVREMEDFTRQYLNGRFPQEDRTTS